MVIMSRARPAFLTLTTPSNYRGENGGEVIRPRRVRGALARVQAQLAGQLVNDGVGDRENYFGDRQVQRTSGTLYPFLRRRVRAGVKYIHEDDGQLQERRSFRIVIFASLSFLKTSRS